MRRRSKKQKSRRKKRLRFMSTAMRSTMKQPDYQGSPFGLMNLRNFKEMYTNGQESLGF